MGRDSTFVDQHIQDGQDMFAQSQEELATLVTGANSGVEETKEAVMGDQTAHLKRSLNSSDSDELDKAEELEEDEASDDEFY
jgi:hypothetical protein